MVEEELNRYQQIITTPLSCAAWVAPIVVITKVNRTIHIYAVAQHYNYPFPVDLLIKKNGRSLFASLDFENVYLQAEEVLESK